MKPSHPWPATNIEILRAHRQSPVPSRMPAATPPDSSPAQLSSATATPHPHKRDANHTPAKHPSPPPAAANPAYLQSTSGQSSTVQPPSLSQPSATTSHAMPPF